MDRAGWIVDVVCQCQRNRDARRSHDRVETVISSRVLIEQQVLLLRVFFLAIQ